MAYVLSNNLSDYLAETPQVDYSAPRVRKKTVELFAACSSEPEIIRAAFVFVRDSIRHSFDSGGGHVPRKASEVLRYGEGVSYAKTLLLAALLRGVNIPAGFCYQKLAFTDNPADGLFLYALNAVFMTAPGAWTRLDARGGVRGRNAEFYVDDPCREQVVMTVRPELGEEEYPLILARPLPVTMTVLEKYQDCAALKAHLPHVFPADGKA